MRVIAGELKGQKILPVPNQLTRPTGDKVKESLFQIIGPFFNEGICLDLFAGSGSLAIEALSRGMERAILVDKQQKAISIIHRNTDSVGLNKRVEIYRNDAFRALKVLTKRGLQFDLIFLDPPYHKISYLKLLDEITEGNLVKKNGTIVCEHDPKLMIEMEPTLFTKIKQEVYSSTTAITIFRRK